MKTVCDFLVASCTADGGIVRYRLTDDGRAAAVGRIPMPCPRWFEVREDRITALLNAPFSGSRSSGLAEYNLATGERLGGIRPTGGIAGCHFAKDGGDVYVAHYGDGTLFSTRGDKLLRHEGHGINPKRQAEPHIHCAFFSPGKRFLLSCDLGLDTLFVYDRDLGEVSAARVPDGAGARHLVFSPDGKFLYVINEMGVSVSVFAWEDGKASYLSTCPLTDTQDESKTGCAIRVTRDGRRIYATERGTNAIVLLDVDGGNLSVRKKFFCGADHPRDLLLIADERYAVCANQFGNTVSLFRVEEDGSLTHLQNLPLTQAICIQEI